MEERGNKTIMCSVFFLDIVEYSKKSVAGQISLKDRFNSYLSAAIRDVPMTDRIIQNDPVSHRHIANCGGKIAIEPILQRNLSSHRLLGIFHDIQEEYATHDGLIAALFHSNFQYPGIRRYLNIPASLVAKHGRADSR